MTQVTAMEPVLPEAKMNLVLPTQPVTCRVVSNTLCMRGKSASFVRHVAIDISGTPLEGNFLAGQSFGIIPPGVDEKGKPHKVRLYSVACPSWGEDGQGRIVSTTPKRLIEELTDPEDPDAHKLYLGVASNYLCDLRPGDEVQVSGPSGKRFLLPVNTDDHDYLFIATGTGIAPFRGMSMELFDREGGPTSSQVHLLMGVAYANDLLYDDLFSRYDTEFANFHYHTAISRESRPDGRRGLYVDRLLEEKIDMFRPLLESPHTLIYICGLAGMQVGIFTALATLGLAEPYLEIKDGLADTPPSDWQPKDVKRYVRPTARCMLEVY
jgi:ferredoxin--NADP+ reductase